MKTAFTFIAAMICIAFGFSKLTAQVRGHQESKIEMFRNIPVEDECQPVIFMMYDDVQVEEWSNKYIRIETTVHALNFGETILNYLVESGRYGIELRESPEDGSLIISMPKRELVIMKKNADMEEFLSIHIYVPKDLLWRLMDPRINLSM